jgi:signal transduction histidine kinase
MVSQLKCWEFSKCHEEACPAYKVREFRCWLVSGTRCHKEMQGKFAEKIEMCLACEIFNTNLDAHSTKETLAVLCEQLSESGRMVAEKEEKLTRTNLELALGLSEVFVALKKMASGDPDVHLDERSNHESVASLKKLVNETAFSLKEMVNLSHEFAMGLTEHFDVLHRVSKGDLKTRVGGHSQVQLLERLKELTNEMIEGVSREIAERKESEAALKQSEDRHRSVFENTGTATVIIEDNMIISLQRHLQDQLQHARKMEAIGTLAGGIAHNFNNLLGIIIGNTDLAMDDIEQWSEARNNLEEVRKASLRAKQMVRQILRFSRDKKGSLELLKPGSLVASSLKLLRASVPSSVQILEEISSKSAILADPAQINQVLVNAVSNAVNAMEGEGTVRVSVADVAHNASAPEQKEGLSPGDSVLLSVSDTGPGIPHDIIHRIFDPYFTTRGFAEGAGLGLAVVHGIVKNHGGAVFAKSEPGKGATIQIFIPIASEDVLKAGTSEEPGAAKIRILFVDDEEAIVKLGQQIVSRLGYEVIATSDAFEALDAFRGDPDGFDLVMTDMAMPQMTGMELA